LVIILNIENQEIEKGHLEVAQKSGSGGKLFLF
jgi:hypothetical protein